MLFPRIAPRSGLLSFPLVVLAASLAASGCSAQMPDDGEIEAADGQEALIDASGNEVITAKLDTFLKTSAGQASELGASEKCFIAKGEKVSLKAFSQSGTHVTGRLMSAHGCGGKFGGGEVVYVFREHFSGFTIPVAPADVPIVDNRANYAATCQYRSANRTAANVGRIVLHNTLGAWESFRSAWQSCGRIGAAHFVVRRDGTVMRTIPERNIAFHAAGANSDSIGVEIETGPHVRSTQPDPQGMTAAQERSVIALTKSLQSKWGVPKSEITMHRIARGAAATSCASNVWGWEDRGGDRAFLAWRDRTF